MSGTLALARAELLRLTRNKRYFIFTVAFPVVLYLLIGKRVNAVAYGVSFGAFYMVSMAMFGAFSGALTGNAQRISQEKKEGWIRQLRLTPLPANASSLWPPSRCGPPRRPSEAAGPGRRGGPAGSNVAAWKGGEVRWRQRPPKRPARTRSGASPG